VKSLTDPPRRTIVFIAFGAEEIGKLGSNYYVLHPCIPLQDTALMINFDMIGRNEPDEIYAVGTTSSPELHAIHQRLNTHVGLTLKHPKSFRLGRSDHTAFYLARIPIMYLFGGLHDGYNTPEDTVDKLIPGKLEKVARLAFLTAWAVADEPSRITFADEVEE
jgi:Zn-dependent M28 family amino/carboxypeptidase